ncbi:MAG: hypothetical protein AAFQ65_01940 [Myxococcota bacterium]
MIISHRYRFIFVKTYKTAGSSIEAFLSNVCGPSDVVTPLAPHVPGHEPRNHVGRFNLWQELVLEPEEHRRTLRDFFRSTRYYSHLPAKVIRSRVPADTWRQYFKFTVERNPWDKTLSHYHMLRRSPLHRIDDLESLDDYFDRGLSCRNYELYTKCGRLLVDRVLRYEALDSELTDVFSQLGVPFLGSLRTRAKSQFRYDRRHYSEVLTGAQIERVADLHQDEISLMGYRRESASEAQN